MPEFDAMFRRSFSTQCLAVVVLRHGVNSFSGIKITKKQTALCVAKIFMPKSVFSFFHSFHLQVSTRTWNWWSVPIPKLIKLFMELTQCQVVVELFSFSSVHRTQDIWPTEPYVQLGNRQLAETRMNIFSWYNPLWNQIKIRVCSIIKRSAGTALPM